MNRAGDRLTILRSQRDLIRQKQAGLKRLMATLERTIAAAEKGDDMPDRNLFEGFTSEAEWDDALKSHNAHLKATYDVDVPPVTDVRLMNAAAAEATAFMSAMASALRDSQKPNAPVVRALVGDHLAFLTANGHPTDASSFVVQTQFFLEDDFHHDMLETQQAGLAAYLNAAARAFAAS